MVRQLLLLWVCSQSRRAALGHFRSGSMRRRELVCWQSGPINRQYTATKGPFPHDLRTPGRGWTHGGEFGGLLQAKDGGGLRWHGAAVRSSGFLERACA